VPPMPGLFSAFGLLVADAEHHATQSLRTRLDRADPAQIAAVLASLAEAGSQRLARDGFPPARQSFRRAASARYVGQSSEIEVPLPDLADAATLLNRLPSLFASEHERTYGFRAPDDEQVELIGLSVIARGTPERPRLPEQIPPATADVPAKRRAWFPDAGWVDTPVMDRASLTAPRPGPLIIQEYDATCLVPRGATAALDAFGSVRVTLV
jgi:N-methylhydantoinase A